MQTQKGDVWILGNHRLICGDATVNDHVCKLMNEKQADMVFTDPPYNVNYQGKTKDVLKMRNDKMSQDKFYEFLYQSFRNMYAVTRKGGGIYIFHADMNTVIFRQAMVKSGWLFKQNLIWAKHHFVFSRQDYHWKHEPILYGWKPGKSHNWFGNRKQTTIWSYDRPMRNRQHPSMKPIEIPKQAIQNSAPSNGIVLDLFLGSGSTLLAAEQSQRVCYGMEIDPIYCDVTIERWEELTGKKAEKAGK